MSEAGQPEPVSEKDRIDIHPVSDPVLKFNVNFVFGGTYKDFVKAVIKETGEEMPMRDAEAQGCFYMHRKKQMFILWLPRDFTAPVLAHELVHVIFEMFSIKEIPIFRDNEEVFAYHLEYWFKAIMECVERSTGDNGKKWENIMP